MNFTSTLTITTGSRMLKVNRYKSLGYTTVFNTDTGFFARIPDAGKSSPFWSPHGPELIDISITNWCDRGCSICYKSSSPIGSHITLDDYKTVIDQVANMRTFQVALGGGNPNQHPDFIEILKYTASKGLVPNYTTNGRGLNDNIIDATSKYCGVVAVSAYYPYDETALAIKTLLSHGVKTNVHFVLDSHSIHTAISWLNQPPLYLDGINAVIFLNYKPLGRNVFESGLLRYSHRLEEFFKLATSPHRKLKVGFDACCISGLFSYTTANTVMVDACDAGRFSMYVSEDLQVYPCSYQSGLVEGDRLGPDNKLQDIWMNSRNFTSFRNYFHSNRCGGCDHRAKCLNGCPIFEDVAVCGNSDAHSDSNIEEYQLGAKLPS